MRSEYVFAASKEINNRFLLCRITSVSARRLHLESTQPSETINKSLKLIAAQELVTHSDAASCEMQSGSAEKQTDNSSPIQTLADDAATPFQES